MKIKNVGATVPLYLNEGPDRKLIGSAVIQKDGSVICSVDDSEGILPVSLHSVQGKVSFALPDFDMPKPFYKYPLPFTPESQSEEWSSHIGRMIKSLLKMQEPIIRQSMLYGAQIRQLEESKPFDESEKVRTAWIAYRKQFLYHSIFHDVAHKAFYKGYGQAPYHYNTY